ncbi:hypothetical protein FJT64_024506 [Amphibalanus amphitrite]|uniref:Uncharacterized protein n=1 Tax=Amphibalanus amphitrite TaxID=1232801 RepID=A0A6A4W860_AMPAM|nr:hypothetical protein FJT64_024506 [Amphibalanus amphitrite]
MIEISSPIVDKSWMGKVNPMETSNEAQATDPTSDACLTPAGSELTVASTGSAGSTLSRRAANFIRKRRKRLASSFKRSKKEVGPD